MVTISDVYLKDGATGQLVKAELYDEILPRHLDHHKQTWKPLTIASDEQHGHWDWQQKLSDYSGQLSYQSFAIECNNQTQGLMIVNTTKRCRLPQAANQHLVYIEYLEAAPWNRQAISGMSKYRGVGTVMVAAAIQLSIDEGNHGRIGLHSLRQADAFYRDHCVFSDLGPDVSYHPEYALRYFEMSEAQATDFKNRGG